MKFIECSFHPQKNIEGKQNYKEMYSIDSKGNVRRRVLLNVSDPRDREMLILIHYIKNYKKLINYGNIQVSIIDRDNPLDFFLCINGITDFNLEITSISDDKQIFIEMKHEEYINQIKDMKQIRARDLIKISTKISPDLRYSELLDKSKNLDEIIDNPFYNFGPSIWMSIKNYEKKEFREIIEPAINEKENKKHLNKEKTVLVIDNRTIHYEIEDVKKYLEENYEILNSYSFREIWLYTGYYSDFEGNDCEFSFMPLKITTESTLALNEKATLNPPDDNGVVYI